MGYNRERSLLSHVGLQKFKHWLFGTVVTLYSDHNPITFLTNSTPKSSKLVRYAGRWPLPSLTSFFVIITVLKMRPQIVCQVWYIVFKKLVLQAVSSDISLPYSRTRFEPRSRGTRDAPSKGAEVPGRCLRHLCPTQSNCKSSDLSVKLKLY